jgi:hypothetical protein
VATFPSTTSDEGIYLLTAESRLGFSEGELWINGREIEALLIEVEFPVQVIGVRVISHFEVETRGRVISFAPVDIAGTIVDAGFVFVSRSSA